MASGSLIHRRMRRPLHFANGGQREGGRIGDAGRKVKPRACALAERLYPPAAVEIGFDARNFGPYGGAIGDPGKSPQELDGRRKFECALRSWRRWRGRSGSLYRPSPSTRSPLAPIGSPTRRPEAITRLSSTGLTPNTASTSPFSREDRPPTTACCSSLARSTSSWAAT